MPKQSRFNEERRLWKALWEAKLYERQKILVWRIASDCLPTRIRLAQVAGLQLHSAEEEQMERLPARYLLNFSAQAETIKVNTDASLIVLKRDGRKD
ncbi:hypothetical protein PanWU01x14_008560 [Parasponia andersonii]|uniref:Uncharacterized protein n=1 Tax=Parasponia andersonii TaxID=3476 RepID=A0A2P5E253_PARAD|nr:hypothetical protein PanWU01x14_008560 [Parasponia andersonii]